jgi:glucosamine 6-phosphate synthetase-like amidotransferase/phosphosugar isomerase protein
MCGIAGYSLSPASRIDRTLAAQALLAAIAERGADAVGYAYRTPEAPIAVRKQRSGASEILDEVEVPADVTEVLVHVRDYTKGHPRIAANNHPIRHGPVVGIHNGIIFNDDELLEDHDCARSEPGMTVDSEAIFALAAHSDADPAALERLRGSMASAWLDERQRGAVFLARGVGRPLWLGQGRGATFFASTERALEIAARCVGIRLRRRELAEGTLVVLENGAKAGEFSFEPDRRFEERPLPAVRAPQEGAYCLDRLATLAAIPLAG